jgi:HAD domain in Swiss Army Knife RNA repair proteins
VTSQPPLFLLDVDGVLNPYAASGCPPGYTEHEFFPGEEPVRLCAAHGPWLQELATRFELTWVSAWGADANRLLAPLLGLPDLPVIGLPTVPFQPRDKLLPVAQYAGRRPLIWIDDQLSAEAHAWAARRGEPTLLIGIDPAEGLTRAVIEQTMRWADNRRRMTSNSPDQLQARQVHKLHSCVALPITSGCPEPRHNGGDVRGAKRED